MSIDMGRRIVQCFKFATVKIVGGYTDCEQTLSRMREQKSKQSYSLACKSTLHYIDLAFWTQCNASEVY